MIAKGVNIGAIRGLFEEYMGSGGKAQVVTKALTGWANYKDYAIDLSDVEGYQNLTINNLTCAVIAYDKHGGGTTDIPLKITPKSYNPATGIYTVNIGNDIFGVTVAITIIP